MRTHIIAAVSKNGIIGKDGGIPWCIPEDMKRFKQLTSGHAIIMGRKTWESIGRALPNRLNIVLSRQSNLELPKGVVLADSLGAALSICCYEGTVEKSFIIGGETVYACGLECADILNLTYVDQDVEGDARFPEWDKSAWEVFGAEEHEGYSFVNYVRREGE